MLQSAVKKPRSIRIGNVGDIFLASEVTARRDKATENKSAKLIKQRKAKAEKTALAKKKTTLVKTLRADLKKEKKANRTTKKRCA